MSSNAGKPMRATEKSAGLDLKSAEDCVILPGSFKLIKTDLCVQLPRGTYGRIAPRSGLASKYGIQIGAGVIDYDYTGPVKVLLFNFGKQSFIIESGNRIAQLICEKIVLPALQQVNNFIDASGRGSKGFGSFGL